MQDFYFPFTQFIDTWSTVYICNPVQNICV